MNFVSKLSRRVVLATFLSILICNLIYTFLIPVTLNYSIKETYEFYRKMIVVSFLISPLSMLSVYLFYVPIKKALEEMERKGSVSEKLLYKAQRAFNNIPNFLFFVGAIAYVAGLILNFFFDSLKGHPIELDHFVSRFFTAFSWGVLNGIVAARILNLIMLKAKLRLKITTLSELSFSKKVNSSFRYFVSGLIFFVFLVSYLSVLFYQQVKHIFKNQISTTFLEEKEKLFSLFLSTDFVKIIGIVLLLFFIVVILYGIIVYEININLKSIYDQVDNLNKDEMDLTRRINIVSFDDIGVMSAGINKFLQKLVDTVKNIKTLSTKVFENSKMTKESLLECGNKTDELSKIMLEIEKMASLQSEIVKSSINVIHMFVEKLDTSINLIQEQTVSVDNTAKGMKDIWNAIEKISSKIGEMKGFITKLSSLVSEGSKNVDETLKSSISIQNTGDSVSEIAKLIEDIAEQSSILAMNAAIEAAHAKEYGVGFAVVAQEMRKLAESTSESTRKIKSLMSEMKNKNSEGLKISNELKVNFQNILAEFNKNEVKFNEINNLVSEETNTARKGLNELETLLKTTERLREQTKVMRESHFSLEDSVNNLNKTAENLSTIQKDLEKGIKFIEDAFKSIYSSFDVSFEAIEFLQKEVEKYKVD